MNGKTKVLDRCLELKFPSINARVCANTHTHTHTHTYIHTYLHSHAHIAWILNSFYLKLFKIYFVNPDKTNISSFTSSFIEQLLLSPKTTISHLPEYIYSKVSKIGDPSRGRSKGSLFINYYTVLGEGATPFTELLHFTFDPYCIMLGVKQRGIKYHLF